jgi:hypothetical protein
MKLTLQEIANLIDGSIKETIPKKSMESTL